MRKTKLLAFSLTVAMLLSVLLVPVNAFVLVETENYSGLTDETVTPNILNPETIGKNYKESAWGASTIDGVMDEKDAYVKGSYTVSNTVSGASSATSTAEYHLWYSNDAEYLYFYLNVDSVDSAIHTSDELARLNFDFFNQHKLSYTAGNAYTNFINGSSTYVGGMLEFNASTDSYKDYKGKIKTNGNITDNDVVITTNGGDYTVEGRVKLPEFIKNSIVAGNQPVIGAAQEVRYCNGGTTTSLGYFDTDTEGFDVSKDEFSSLYNNHTISPDLVLATSTSTLKNSEVSEQVTLTEPITDTLNAVMDDGEGWAKVPYLKLDRLANGITGIAGEKGSVDVYVSTDGENLYLFYEAPVAINNALGMIQLSDNFFRNDSKGTDNRDWFVYFNAYDTGNGVEYSNQYRTGSKYTSGDGTRFGQITAVHNDDKTVWEMKIPLPDGSYNKIDGYDNDIVEQLKNGDVTIKFNAFINSNNGYYHSSLYSTTNWNKAQIPLTLPKAPSNSNIVVEGLQDRVEADGLTDVRFLASLKGDYQDYEALGFEFGYQEHNATANCKYVYTSIKAGDDLVTPDLYEADYFFCYTIYNLEAGDYVFTVRSWSQKEGESKSYSEATVFDITVNQDGSVTAR